MDSVKLLTVRYGEYMEFECDSVEDAARDALWYMDTNHRSPMRILWNGLEVWQSLPETPRL